MWYKESENMEVLSSCNPESCILQALPVRFSSFLCENLEVRPLCKVTLEPCCHSTAGIPRVLQLAVIVVMEAIRRGTPNQGFSGQLQFWAEFCSVLKGL